MNSRSSIIIHTAVRRFHPLRPNSKAKAGFTPALSTIQKPVRLNATCGAQARQTAQIDWTPRGFVLPTTKAFAPRPVVRICILKEGGLTRVVRVTVNPPMTRRVFIPVAQPLKPALSRLPRVTNPLA